MKKYYDKRLCKPVRNADRRILYLLAFRSYTVTQSREYACHEVRDKAYELGYNALDVQETINDAVDDAIEAMQKFLTELRVNAEEYADKYVKRFSDTVPSRY